ncbi:MAG: helix-turn-helix domain-containing protein [Roseburia sp.]|uniref:PucR family transcriptional regulator n=1 Tax=Roseburia sp. 831b TaxID=1261635 RepID=UPI000953272D|nr:helix-turn-helix domain-containing protein [Roseburia sp. 831b]MCI5919537.1 helix-turn-helix domain-containing protein [Roseburia sp.]MDD6217364.1 helix-turn-helix domain-containing protein [Roseburia sp.]MDY5882954.1 helix-turn-helix domain-containing protein [Roseburia sp.]WVK73601.1 helix-turn-helix domain-containing protein [Roseburia sp. 831b]
MISNHKIQTTLDEIREISHIELALYTEKGKQVAATFEPEGDMETAVASFAVSMAESQMLAGCHFFKVIVEGEVEYILLTKSGTEDAYMIGRLAVCQIRNMVAAHMEQFDRNNFMQNILLGNMLVVDMYNKAQKLHIEQSERVVFVIDVERKKDSTIMEMVKNLFVTKAKDFVTEVDEQSIILVKDTRDMKEEDNLENLAEMIVDNLHAEAMVRVRVGYGNRVRNLQDIAKSYQEAKMALEVGRIFYADKEIISYSKLGIGRLIYQLPMSLCEMFIQEVFGGGIPDIFNEETLTTIQKFFENNLNISETARQLYVHRNTLVYRLERLEKIIGLDIRKFDDAMTFKIAMMVLDHMHYQGHTKA